MEDGDARIHYFEKGEVDKEAQGIFISFLT
jgi:hypothetical protein